MIHPLSIAVRLSSRAFISREHIDLGVDLVGQAVGIVAKAVDLRERAAPARRVDLPTWTPALRRVRRVARAIDTKLGRRVNHLLDARSVPALAFRRPCFSRRRALRARPCGVRLISLAARAWQLHFRSVSCHWNLRGGRVDEWRIPGRLARRPRTFEHLRRLAPIYDRRLVL